ncbi:MAG: hypothetical protein ACI82I_000859 [Gammaproteobacteria bacterium]|jgi:hypothetical protein
MIRKLFLAVALTCISPSLALSDDRESNIIFGHDFDLAQIRKETEFTVVIQDGVTDGCWLNAARAKSQIERELLDAGYLRIVEKRVWGVEIFVEVIGFATTQGQCAAHVTYDLSLSDGDFRQNDDYQWIAVKYLRAASFGFLLTGPKNSISGRINDAIAGITDEVLVDIQQAKNAVFSAIEEAEGSEGAKAYLKLVLE